MDKKIETLTISQVMKILLEYHKLFGDMPVFHVSDPEGNSYGTLHLRSFGYDNTKIGKALFISPFAENVEVFDENDFGN